MFAWAHAEHGLGMHVYTPAQRDAPTNMINNAMAVGAVHKLRFAQDLILYNLALSEEIEGFDGAAHKEAWQNDPIWQPTRELVETLTGIRDWGEALFATTVVFEPLVGELFRSGFVMQAAAPQGDFVTPTIIGAGESDAAREQQGARALFRMLTDDEAHGDANRATMRAGWTTYVPQAVNAARNLQPIWSQPSEKVVRFEDSFERSQARFESLLGDIGLEPPEGVPRMTTFDAEPDVVEHGRRDADEQPGRLRRGRRDARQGERDGHRAAVDDPRRRRQTRSTSTTRRSPRRSGGTTSATTTSRRSCRPTTGAWSCSTIASCCSRTRRTRPSTSASTSSRSSRRSAHVREGRREVLHLRQPPALLGREPGELGQGRRRSTPRAGSSASTPTRASARRRRTGRSSTSRSTRSRTSRRTSSPRATSTRPCFQSTYLKEWYTKGFNDIEQNAALLDRFPGKLIVNGRWDPREGEAGLRQLEADHAKYGLQGVKLYTAEWYEGSRGWKLTDPEAVPFLDKCAELGIKNIHVHKGPTIWPLDKDAFDVSDVDHVATDYNGQLNFIVEHVGLPRIEDFCFMATQEPNVYAGLAVVIGGLMHARPQFFAKVMGELLFWVGEDKMTVRLRLRDLGAEVAGRGPRRLGDARRRRRSPTTRGSAPRARRRSSASTPPSSTASRCPRSCQLPVPEDEPASPESAVGVAA